MAKRVGPETLQNDTAIGKLVKSRHWTFLRSDLFDQLIIALILAKEFILDYLGVGLFVNGLLCLLIAIRLIVMKFRIPSILIAITGTLLFLAALQLFLVGGDLLVAGKNIARLGQVGFYALYLLYLKLEKPDFIQSSYRGGLILFNGVLIVNSIVMVIQYLCPGVLVAAQNGPTVFPEDLISGLFGYGSTHAVAIYTTFVVIYDISAIKKFPRRKMFLMVFVAFVMITSSLIAGINDNKALFFCLPLSLILYWMISFSFNPKAIGKTTLIILLPTVALSVSAYLAIPPLQHFVNDNIIHSFEIIVNACRPDSYVNGSDERIKLLFYALSLPSTWLLGDGFGMTDIYQSGYRGFAHFGLSDYGSLAIVGGIWFYVLLVAFYVYISIKPTDSWNKNTLVFLLAMIVLHLFMSIFTQIFSQVRIGIVFMMLAYALYCHWQDLTFRRE